jgi:hypothetical protein
MMEIRQASDADLAALVTVLGQCGPSSASMASSPPVRPADCWVRVV